MRTVAPPEMGKRGAEIRQALPGPPARPQAPPRASSATRSPALEHQWKRAPLRSTHNKSRATRDPTKSCVGDTGFADRQPDPVTPKALASASTKRGRRDEHAPDLPIGVVDRGLDIGQSVRAAGLGRTCASRESNEMRPLRYSINVTLDGCCHHEAGLPPDEESMRYWTAEMERADALLFGRVTYEMMESAWRQPATGSWPDWMGEWEIPFAETINRAKKYVVSSTLSGVDWNAELVRGDLGQAVQRLKQEPGERLFVGSVTLPLALADLGLIDEYEFLVQPVLAGHGPTLLAGLRERIQLELVDRHEFRSGAVAVRYQSTRATA
jgi:dihydrofolate reductase